MKKCTFLITVTVAWLVFFVGPSFSTTFSRLVVFGDSLSDNGNIYALTSGASPASPLAYNGRFSNGIVWAEYLAEYLGAGLVDLAQAGAETGDSASVPFGLKKQVSDFATLVSAYPAMVSNDTLYAVWAGPNDFLNGSLDVNVAANNIGVALDALANIGAGYIIVPNMPDLGATPLNNTSPTLSTGARMLTQGFNQALENVVETFKQANPAVKIYEINTFEFFSQILADPGAYGFTNTTGTYLSVAGSGIDDKDSYLFWDDIHPTTAGHREFARTIAGIINDTNSAWFSPSGELTIPQVFVNEFEEAYKIVLTYDASVSTNPADLYFKLTLISDNNL